jgi:hypothetical protein
MGIWGRRRGLDRCDQPWRTIVVPGENKAVSLGFGSEQGVGEWDRSLETVVAHVEATRGRCRLRIGGRSAHAVFGECAWTSRGIAASVRWMGRCVIRRKALDDVQGGAAEGTP